MGLPAWGTSNRVAGPTPARVAAGPAASGRAGRGAGQRVLRRELQGAVLGHVRRGGPPVRAASDSILPPLAAQRSPKSWPSAGIRSRPSYHLCWIPIRDPGFEANPGVAPSTCHLPPPHPHLVVDQRLLLGLGVLAEQELGELGGPRHRPHPRRQPPGVLERVGEQQVAVWRVDGQGQAERGEDRSDTPSWG